MGGACSTHERDEKCIKNVGENQKGRNNSEDLCVDGRIILKLILGEQGGSLWAGCIWLRMGTSCRLL